MNVIKCCAVWCIVLICVPFLFAGSEANAEDAGLGHKQPRNPFASLLYKPKTAKMLLIPESDSIQQPTPLQQVEEIGQLKVIGIVQGELGQYGVIAAPDGKVYMVTIGTQIGRFEGKVTAITGNAVTIQEIKHYQKGDAIETEVEDTSLFLIPITQEKTAPVQKEETSSSPQKSFNPTNRREPFQSLISHPDIVVELIIPELEDDNADPLQHIENIKHVQVMGIMQGELGDYGMIQAPDGNMYLVTVGTRVGKFSGTVTAITEKAVEITETKTYQVGEMTETQEEVTVLGLKALNR